MDIYTQQQGAIRCGLYTIAGMGNVILEVELAAFTGLVTITRRAIDDRVLAHACESMDSTRASELRAYSRIFRIP